MPLSYDQIGNLTSYNGRNFVWQNGRQLMIVYGDNMQTAVYNYDANGVRTRKSVAGVTTDYVLSGTNILRETSPGKDLIYSYDCTGKRFSFKYNGTTYYYVYNYQGDVIKLLDSNFNVVAKYTYDAWGNPVSITDGNGNNVANDVTNIANVNPFRYRGYYWDSETSLYYLNSRYYDPQIGRFINADDVINEGLLGSNLYAYCENNPVMYNDSTGMNPALAIGGVVLTVGEVIVIAALLVVCISYAFNIGGFRDTVNNAVAWAINRGITAADTIAKQFPKLGRWAAGVIASLVAAYTTYAATKVLPGIAKKYSPKAFKCDEAANAMKDALKKLKLHGQIITLTFPPPLRGTNYVMSNRYPSFAIGNNGFHMGVLFGGKVYCTVYPEGLPEQQWINSFYNATGRAPAITRVPF